jgi:hypothetical protein
MVLFEGGDDEAKWPELFEPAVVVLHMPVLQS